MRHLFENVMRSLAETANSMRHSFERFHVMRSLAETANSVRHSFKRVHIIRCLTEIDHAMRNIFEIVHVMRFLAEITNLMRHLSDIVLRNDIEPDMDHSGTDCCSVTYGIGAEGERYIGGTPQETIIATPT
jgi:hypothetical protein